MENKWEYDYSGLYNNQQTQPAQSDQPEPQAQPQPEAAPPVVEAAPQPPVKKSGAGRILLRVVAALLVVALSFGAGYGGAMLALRQNPQSVVYQAAPQEDKGTALLAAPGEAADLSAVASIISPSVVVITTEKLVNSGYSFWFGGQYVQSGAGSGVIMTEDGYIITNQHVVNGATNVTVTLNDDSSYTATVVGMDSINDIAVIKIDAAGLTPAIMGDSDQLVVGETAIAVGNPMGTLGGTVTNGIISALNRNIRVEGQTMNLIQTNAAISPGNSGGGLFNARGELVGIVNAKSGNSGAEGLGFAIPVNTALQVATDLINSGYVTGRPVMGISVIDITDAEKAAQYGVTSMGVYIAEVNSGSGAEQAGLEAGDRIISVDGMLIEGKNQVVDAIQSKSVGDTVKVQVARDGQLMEFEVTLGESQS